MQVSRKVKNFALKIYAPGPPLGSNNLIFMVISNAKTDLLVMTSSDLKRKPLSEVSFVYILFRQSSFLCLSNISIYEVDWETYFNTKKFLYHVMK